MKTLISLFRLKAHDHLSFTADQFDPFRDKRVHDKVHHYSYKTTVSHFMFFLRKKLNSACQSIMTKTDSTQHMSYGPKYFYRLSVFCVLLYFFWLTDFLFIYFFNPQRHGQCLNTKGIMFQVLNPWWLVAGVGLSLCSLVMVSSSINFHYTVHQTAFIVFTATQSHSCVTHSLDFNI